MIENPPRAHLGQPVDHARMLLARPRPVADFEQASVVDRDQDDVAAGGVGMEAVASRREARLPAARQKPVMPKINPAIAVHSKSLNGDAPDAVFSRDRFDCISFAR